MTADPYDPAELRRLADAVTAIAVRWLETGEQERTTTALGPEEIARRFDEPLPAEGRPLEEIVGRLERDYVSEATRLIHPRYVGHQVAPPLPAAGPADLLVSVMNNGQAVWEMSPTGTVLEHRVLAWFSGLVGWDPRRSGGTFVSGGAVGNLSALAAARAAAFPEAWEEGMDGRRGSIVCASSAHYCIERAAGVLGLGLAGVESVPDVEGRLDPARAREAVQAARARGRTVLALVATAGSTPIGAIDDLEALADVADELGLWLHVDAAHAGSFLLSDRLRPLLRGLERAESVAIDLHKMMLQPISTAIVLLRDRRRLAAAFSQSAPYLFHGTGHGASWDLGALGLQCSRRIDVLRVWLCLQLHGSAGIARLQEHCVDVAGEAAERIAARADFELAHRPQTNILCFRHVPAALAGDDAALDRHNADLRERLNRSGRAFVTGTLLEGRRVLRLTIINPRTEIRHVEGVLDEIAGLAVGR